MKKRIVLCLALFGLCCPGIGGFVFLQSRHDSSPAQQQKETAGVTKTLSGSSQQAIEVPPTTDEKNNHKTPGPNPRYLSVAKLDLQKARITPVSTTTDDRIEAPANIYDAGWYTKSAKPGEAGAVFIDAHVSGPHNPGIFSKLKSLRLGDGISIERGDGVTVKYVVEYVEQISASEVDMRKALNPYVAGKNGLNLMTCGGMFDKQTNQYQDRVIVYASQV